MNEYYIQYLPHSAKSHYILNTFTIHENFSTCIERIHMGSDMIMFCVGVVV